MTTSLTDKSMKTTTNVAEAKAYGWKIKLICNECGKTFKVSPKAADPDCPKCGGVDWDVL